MLSVQEKTEDGFLGQSSCFVSAKGEFDSEAFGPSGGLKDGRYLAEAIRFRPYNPLQSNRSAA
jgi:hypothetical protein